METSVRFLKIFLPRKLLSVLLVELDFPFFACDVLGVLEQGLSWGRPSYFNMATFEAQGSASGPIKYLGIYYAINGPNASISLDRSSEPKLSTARYAR
jgi:hypothetical protein